MKTDPEEIVDDSNDEVIDQSSDPGTIGEASLSGSSPDPVSDDNTLESAQAVGLRLDETDDASNPLNLAGDVARAEQARRSPPQNDVIADVSDDQVRHYVGTADYPINKSQLIEHALRHGANHALVSRLDLLPERAFESPEEVVLNLN